MPLVALNNSLSVIFITKFLLSLSLKSVFTILILYSFGETPSMQVIIDALPATPTPTSTFVNLLNEKFPALFPYSPVSVFFVTVPILSVSIKIPLSSPALPRLPFTIPIIEQR